MGRKLTLEQVILRVLRRKPTSIWYLVDSVQAYPYETKSVNFSKLVRSKVKKLLAEGKIAKRGHYAHYTAHPAALEKR